MSMSISYPRDHFLAWEAAFAEVKGRNQTELQGGRTDRAERGRDTR